MLGGIAIVGEYGDGGAALIPILGLVYGAIGSGAGAGLDAMNRGEQVIYSRRSAPSKVALRPIVGAGRTGVLASIAFGGS